MVIVGQWGVRVLVAAVGHWDFGWFVCMQFVTFCSGVTVAVAVALVVVVVVAVSVQFQSVYFLATLISLCKTFTLAFGCKILTCAIK